jgi:hypothetical protein
MKRSLGCGWHGAPKRTEFVTGPLRSPGGAKQFFNEMGFNGVTYESLRQSRFFCKLSNVHDVVTLPSLNPIL